MSTPRSVTVDRCSPADVVGLRHSVLRPHTTADQALFPGDERPVSAHFCARSASGEVVGVATVWPEAPPWEVRGEPGPLEVPAGGAWRLRGMATAPHWQGQGVGALVLRAALAHAEEQGGLLLWCNARWGAVEFYRRAGLATWGEVWEEPVIGPHVVMFKRLRTPVGG